MDIAAIVAILGVILGVFIKTYYPWLKKKSEAEQAGEQVSFKPKYLVTALVSLLVTSIVALYAVAAWQMPDVSTVEGLIGLFTAGMSYGYAFNAVINLPLDAKN
jgi:uncharacterized Tic20 family protein